MPLHLSLTPCAPPTHKHTPQAPKREGAEGLSGDAREAGTHKPCKCTRPIGSPVRAISLGADAGTGSSDGQVASLACSASTGSPLSAVCPGQPEGAAAASAAATGVGGSGGSSDSDGGSDSSSRDGQAAHGNDTGGDGEPAGAGDPTSPLAIMHAVALQELRLASLEDGAGGGGSPAGPAQLPALSAAAAAAAAAGDAMPASEAAASPPSSPPPMVRFADDGDNDVGSPELDPAPEPLPPAPEYVDLNTIKVGENMNGWVQSVTYLLYSATMPGGAGLQPQRAYVRIARFAVAMQCASLRALAPRRLRLPTPEACSGHKKSRTVPVGAAANILWGLIAIILHSP